MTAILKKKTFGLVKQLCIPHRKTYAALLLLMPYKEIIVIIIKWQCTISKSTSYYYDTK